MAKVNIRQKSPNFLCKMTKSKWGYMEVVRMKEVPFEWSHLRISSSDSKVKKKKKHTRLNQLGERVNEIERCPS